MFSRSHFAHFLSAALLCALTLAPALPLHAAGLTQQGASARGLALGGAVTASAAGPLDALFANPATLSVVRGPTLELSGYEGLASGSFHNRANDHAHLGEDSVFGSGAIATAVGPVRFGLGVHPEIASRAQWRYRDTPGGADGQTSYGMRTHESELLLLRTSLGMSWQVTPALSLGASAGLLYNRNRLHAPYIFQSQPTLRTVKTLLELDTEGYGWNAQAGLLWQPIKALQLGLSYTTRARIKTEGTATGNAGVQLTNLGLGAAQHDFSYDAEVTNVFPDQASAGLAWQVTKKLTVLAQVDWIHWENAFDTLPVRLSHGSNRDLNALVGGSKLADDIPLHWRDQLVWHLAGEYALDERWSLRGGYSYGRNPVPGDTLTPLTAAISEHTVSAGVGFALGRAKIDLGWLWQLPATAHTGTSVLAAGEYRDSTIRTSVHWLGVGTAVEF